MTTDPKHGLPEYAALQQALQQKQSVGSKRPFSPREWEAICAQVRQAQQAYDRACKAADGLDPDARPFTIKNHLEKLNDGRDFVGRDEYLAYQHASEWLDVLIDEDASLDELLAQSRVIMRLWNAYIAVLRSTPTPDWIAAR